MDMRGDAQQHEGDHRGQQLKLDGVLVLAKELADVEMQLQPAEPQLDRLARLVGRGDLHRVARHVVGDHHDDLRLCVEKLDEDGILKAHARRSFLSLDNQKLPRNPRENRTCARDQSTHSPDSRAASGERECAARSARPSAIIGK